LEIEIGGLLILEEISLLKTVFENPELVLLARNLNNYNNKNAMLGLFDIAIHLP